MDPIQGYLETLKHGGKQNQLIYSPFHPKFWKELARKAKRIKDGKTGKRSLIVGMMQNEMGSIEDKNKNEQLKGGTKTNFNEHRPKMDRNRAKTRLKSGQ